MNMILHRYRDSYQLSNIILWELDPRVVGETDRRGKRGTRSRPKGFENILRITAPITLMSCDVTRAHSHTQTHTFDNAALT